MDTTKGAPCVHKYTRCNVYAQSTAQIPTPPPPPHYFSTHTCELNKLQNEHTHQSASNLLTHSLKWGVFPHRHCSCRNNMLALPHTCTHTHQHTCITHLTFGTDTQFAHEGEPSSKEHEHLGTQKSETALGG